MATGDQTLEKEAIVIAQNPSAYRHSVSYGTGQSLHHVAMNVKFSKFGNPRRRKAKDRGRHAVCDHSDRLR